MSLSSESQVLVVGAGPIGLASAITLARLGVHVTIVDSSLSNKNGSRSAAVNARTLEVLDSIDLAQPLIEAGIRSDSIVLRGKKSTLVELYFSQLRDVTKFPMTLFIPQGTLERVFEDKLVSEGIKILKNKTVVGIRQSEVANRVEVTFEDGSVTRTQYVVGADGSRSTIRRLMGIEFRDPKTRVAYEDRVPPSLQVVLADVYLKEPLPASIPRDRVTVHLDKLLILVPLRLNTASEDGTMSYWRVIQGIPVEGPRPPGKPSLEYLQQQLDERNPYDTKITIASATQSSRYRVRSAAASTFLKKLGDSYILLAGDAAHVHSPVGGQGMNLGICDAVALGHAVHSHIQATKPEDGDRFLQSYADSRRNTAIRVMGLAGGLTTIVNASHGWRRWLRNSGFWIFRHLPYVNRFMAWRVSGLVNRTI